MIYAFQISLQSLAKYCYVKVFITPVKPFLWRTFKTTAFHCLYVVIMSCTRFRVNPHFIVTWMSRNSLLEIGTISEVQVTATGLEPLTNEFINEHSSPHCVWLSVIYELNDCGFESHCSHLYHISWLLKLVFGKQTSQFQTSW